METIEADNLCCIACSHLRRTFRKRDKPITKITAAGAKQEVRKQGLHISTQEPDCILLITVVANGDFRLIDEVAVSGPVWLATQNFGGFR